MRALRDLGQCLGADLYEREVEFLISTEWARSAEDILWRRTKLGLRFSPAEIENEADQVPANPICQTEDTDQVRKGSRSEHERE